MKFVCLNTNAMEFDYSRPIPDFTFLEKELTDRKDEFDKTVVSMHVRPYADQFNNNVARVFHRYVTEFPVYSSALPPTSTTSSRKTSLRTASCTT